MARKTADVAITAENRDKGKLFRLTEMDAFATAKWGERVAFAVLSGGRERIRDADIDQLVNIDWDDKEGGARAGLALVAVLGFRVLTGIDPDVMQPLLDELMGCVQIVPDPQNNPSFARNLMKTSDDIEEAGTILRLKSEVFNLHTGFSLAAVFSKVSTAAMMRRSQDSSTTQTSPPPLEQ